MKPWKKGVEQEIWPWMFGNPVKGYKKEIYGYLVHGTFGCTEFYKEGKHDKKPIFLISRTGGCSTLALKKDWNKKI